MCAFTAAGNKYAKLCPESVGHQAALAEGEGWACAGSVTAARAAAYRTVRRCRGIIMSNLFLLIGGLGGGLFL